MRWYERNSTSRWDSGSELETIPREREIIINLGLYASVCVCV